ncbi:SIR2 family NAD-dependent protein deacylase [Rhodococcoides corynebacterioides]|uniref:SIR2 family NAD-dependent protein deacylase n=1 Tax=Rhodococcoides corynebacterioides TaxID=53972 RepID=UPI001C9B7D42|nr:NAD-dependent deacylase [Rhodococcus corynebacterioides]MBY6350496.1 NAD-dependent deacylase [Rhodococcus corynebacterioides]
MTATLPDDVLTALRRADTITVLTGAGMSAQSGIPTFRDAQTGLWSRFDPADLASHAAFVRDPDLVWGWYRRRAALAARAEPNAGHVALARWQQHAADRGGRLTIATQNVDDLHERAGAVVAAHVHGSLTAVRCSICDTPYHGPLDDTEDLDGTGDDTEDDIRVPPPPCADCGSPVRPDIVWFGEALPEDAWRAAETAAQGADVVLVIGTSGVVYPFAGLPALARSAGALVIEIDPAETAVSDMAHHHLRDGAADALPALLDSVLDHGEVR